ncbi:telomere repeat binding factor (TRF) domain-containing protein [Hirsutella rhossiliensis]|uniref:Telomere repeat binding factor (TRF) domain-containing protein n=1 Tax=Hirsutella rhossiliensis TaxID=111463 RepID=A0A9P8SLD9_9HYPO|nr:telomere repeat binding factor (TRF) domain-containing protein [Hirsutella rhossiliensis]KAH0966856.1 telomere repeat binding factor (TRF) domain-containing protein [Hirsutella rhossiliensis]
MAEPAQAAESASASSIKQEPDPIDLDGLDFTDLSRELASKRPFEQVDQGPSQTPEAKRAKTEIHDDEELLENGLALLVQNALSNVGDLVDHFSAESDEPPTATTEPMDIDAAPAPPEPRRARPSFSADPQAYVRDMNINALGCMALSLLHILVQQPLDDTMGFIKDAESDHGRSYRQLRHSFEQLRLLYTPKPALSAKELGMDQDELRTWIELANLAQLGSWLADGSPGSLSEADEHFLAMFSCQVSDLPPGMTELYLGIMTQRAVESLVVKGPEKPSEEVLGEVLLSGLEDRLRGQHGGDELTSADQTFVSTVQSRKETLQGEAEEQMEPTTLREKHPTEHLLRTFVSCVRSRLRSESELCSRFGISIELGDDEPTIVQEATDPVDDVEIDFDELSSFFEKTASGLVQNALAGLTEDAGSASTPMEESGEPSTETIDGEPKADTAPALTNGKIDLMTDYKELEALVAESTSNYVKTTLHGLSPIPYQPTVPQTTTESMAAQTPYLQQLQQHQAQHPYYATCSQPVPEPQMPSPSPGEHLPPNQTFPSAILYDKARQAALCKSSAHTRREGVHSTRRPWTQEEEKALMAGLDMVKGPHWSQILTLFGHNGTISDILKDRTQVQLKDKARNLKLFFLKTNSEMPYYLQAVTGELKTRAPTQAARKEAEERAKLTSDEEQAKLQGIMALAGGLQHPPQTRVAPAPTATASTTNTAAPAKAPAAASGVGSPAQAAGNIGGASTAPVQGVMFKPPAGNTATQAAAQRPALATSTAGTHHAGRPSGVQATTQQVLQAMPQAPLRPQSQLPRPQTQQGNPSQSQVQTQPQTQKHNTPATAPPSLQPTQRPLAQASPTVHGHPAPAPSPASTSAPPPAPIPVPGHPPLKTSPPPPPPSQEQLPPQQKQPPEPAPAPPAAQRAQPVKSASPTLTPPPPTRAMPPEPPNETQHDDSAAEAALLEGLQAVVAQSLA